MSSLVRTAPSPTVAAQLKLAPSTIFPIAVAMNMTTSKPLLAAMVTWTWTY